MRKSLSLWLGVSLGMLVGCGQSQAEVEGKIAFYGDWFEMELNEPFSNHGLCVYERKKVTPLYQWFTRCRWSKDGKLLFVKDADDSKGRTLVKIEWENKTIQKTQLKRAGIPVVPFPDLSKVVYIADDNENERNSPRNIYLYDLETGEEKQLTQNENPESSYGGLDVSPDGKKILFSKAEQSTRFPVYVYELDLETREIARLFEGDDCRYSPDGKRIVYIYHVEAKGPTHVLIYDIATGLRTQVTSQPNSGYDQPEGIIKQDPCFSPDGTKIAFINWISGGKEIEVVNVDGTNRFVLVPATREHRDVMSLDWGP